MIFRIMALVVLGWAFAIVATASSRLTILREQAQSQEALAETTTHIFSLLQKRNETIWNRLELRMNAEFGPQWTNELNPAQWIRIHEIEQESKGGGEGV